MSSETKKELVSQSTIDDLVGTIKTRYLKTHLKAKEFIEAVLDVTDACVNFKNHCKDKQLQIDGKDVDFVSYINGNSDVIGFRYNQFNKYVSLRDRKVEVKNLLNDGKPEYIMCHGEAVTPTLDNIKLALTPRSDDDGSSDVKKTIAELLEASIKEIADKLADDKKAEAEETIATVSELEKKKEELEKSMEKVKDAISKSRKIISSLKSSVPKEVKTKKPKKDKPPVPTLDSVKKVLEAV